MPAKPLGRRPRKTREQIFTAAMELFRHHGMQSVTMQDIADAADAARSTVFNHYPTKNDLLADFFRRFAEDLVEGTPAPEEEGFETVIRRLVTKLGRDAEREAVIFRDVAALALGSGPLAADEARIDDVMTGLFTRAIHCGIARGELRPDLDPDLAASVLLGLITATNHGWVNRGQTGDLAADHNARLDILLQGLARQG